MNNMEGQIRQDIQTNWSRETLKLIRYQKEKEMKREKLQQRIAIHKKFQGHCAYCGILLKLDNMTVDHLISKKNGGSGNLENLLPCCSQCNSYKSDFTVEEWREYLEKDINKDFADKKLMVLERIGLIAKTRIPVVFYFEKHKCRK